MNQSIPILTSSGGYGHISATIALEEAFDAAGIATHRVFALTDIVGSCDVMSRMSCGRVRGEDLYNTLLRRRQYGLINGIVKIGLLYYAWQHTRMDSLCAAYIKREMPRAVISVAPLINGSMARACAAAGVPFYIVPTDLDMRLFVDNLTPDACDTTTVLLPFEHEALRTQVPDYASYVVNGPVVRSQFFNPCDKTKVREELGIDPEKKMIVAMLGGQGVASASDIVRALGNHETPCTIATINAPPSSERRGRPTAIITEFGFRKDIARFIKAADLLVTKGGSMSVLEALVSKTPLLLDATRGMLRWEKFNYRFIEELGYGKKARTLADMSSGAKKILGNSFTYGREIPSLETSGAEALVSRLISQLSTSRPQAQDQTQSR